MKEKSVLRTFTILPQISTSLDGECILPVGFHIVAL